MNKVPSIVQILAAEFLAIWGTSSFVVAVWNTARPGSFGTASLRGLGNWIWFLIGLALLVWLLREIFQARVKQDSWVQPKTWSSSRGSYGFCSTHPSYFFIDLIPVAVSAFLLWYARGAGIETKNYGIMLAISLALPALRLLSWYLLGLKIKDKDARTAWKPAAIVFVPVVVVFAAIGIAVAFGTRRHQTDIANLPVIDAQTFSPSREAFTRLLDTSQSEKQTGLVRLRAKQISDGPVKCQNNEHIEFATMLVDLSAGGDVLIVASKYAHAGFDELVNKSAGNKAREIEADRKSTRLNSSHI